MTKKWNFCLHCKRLQECIAGKERTKGINENSPTCQDIGCFNEEQYIKQIQPKQMNIVFEPQ